MNDKCFHTLTFLAQGVVVDAAHTELVDVAEWDSLSGNRCLHQWTSPPQQGHAHAGEGLRIVVY